MRESWGTLTTQFLVIPIDLCSVNPVWKVDISNPQFISKNQKSPKRPCFSPEITACITSLWFPVVTSDYEWAGKKACCSSSFTITTCTSKGLLHMHYTLPGTIHFHSECSGMRKWEFRGKGRVLSLIFRLPADHSLSAIYKLPWQLSHWYD